MAHLLIYRISHMKYAASRVICLRDGIRSYVHIHIYIYILMCICIMIYEVYIPVPRE